MFLDSGGRSDPIPEVVWSAWSYSWSSMICCSCAMSMRVAMVDREDSAGT